MIQKRYSDEEILAFILGDCDPTIASEIQEKIKLERANLKKNQEALTSYLNFVSETKKVMSEEHKETTALIRETRKQIKAEEKLMTKRKGANYLD